MKLASVAVLVLVAAPGAVLGQQPPHERQLSGGVAAVKALYHRLTDLYVKSADLMPEEHYAFKPTPDVRSFGEILGHVANEHYIV